MAIKYYKLINILNQRKISKMEFAKQIGISSKTLAKLSKDETVTLDVIDKACRFLNVQPGDILEYINIDQN